jgi:serine/threonine-protein kinase RsbW
MTTARTATQAVAREQARPVVWWGRDFPGGTDQVGEARHWVEDLLPGCDPLADILLLASELSTNAVMHTRSGQAGGRFTVDIEWAPDVARVVIGDQGSPTILAIGARPGEATWTDESGRGLWLVDELADDWGTAGHSGHRWVWADLQWQARGGPPLRVPGGTDAAVARIAAIRAAFPGTTVWWSHLTGAWRAAAPGAANAGGLLSSPTLGSLCRVLANVHPGSPPACRLPFAAGPEAGTAGTAEAAPYPPAAPRVLADLACPHPTGNPQGKALP